MSIPENIRNARTRLYRLENPPSYYSQYQYATVDDDATLTLMYEQRDPSIVSTFSDIRMAGVGISREYLRETADPPTEDRAFRNRRLATLNLVSPPSDPAELTPMQRIAHLLLAVPPLEVPAADPWQDWETPRARRTHRSALLALLQQSNREESVAEEDTGRMPYSWDRWYGEPQTQAAITIDRPRRNIADAMIRDAISQNAMCPISMEPITQETGTCVAPCYHVFDRESIAQWLDKEATCPTCREPCRM